MGFIESLPTFFADFGITAAAGGLSTAAIFDAPDQPILEGRAQSKEYAITHVANALGQLRYGNTITISGTPGGVSDGTYKVLVVHDVEDGQIQRVLLEKP